MRRFRRSAHVSDQHPDPRNDSARSAKTEELLKMFEGMDSEDLAEFSEAMASKMDSGHAPDKPSIEHRMLDASFEHPFGWVWAEPLDALGWFSGTPEELAAYLDVETSYTGFEVRQTEARIAILHDTYESPEFDTVAERYEAEGLHASPQPENRIMWKDLADRFDMQLENSHDLAAFENTLFRGVQHEGPHWPAFWPDSGLQAATAATLWPLLVTESGELDCYFFASADWNFKEGTRAWNQDLRLWTADVQPHAPVFYRGRIEQWLADDTADRWTLNTLWPTDHSWHVYSNDDLRHTIVGGTRSLIEAISNHPELETLEVPVDSTGD